MTSDTSGTTNHNRGQRQGSTAIAGDARKTIVQRNCLKLLDNLPKIWPKSSPLLPEIYVAFVGGSRHFPGGQIRCTIGGLDRFERLRRNAVRLQWQLAAHLFSSPDGDHTRAEMVLTAAKSICRSDLAREGFGSSQSISGEDS